MVFAFGVALFALALLFSIAWHECGHMWAAQATGMKVRRYFVGFGPTVWSTRRGETEYGIKAIPLGGFCDIAGMTPHDDLAPEDEPRAMYRQKAWKRLVVLFAGPAQNFILGFVLLYLVAIFAGLPNLADDADHAPVHVTKVSCVATATDDKGELLPCDGVGPAQTAGMQVGDQIVAVNGHDVVNNADLITTTQAIVGTATVDVLRNGQALTLEVPVTQVERKSQNSDGTLKSIQVGAMGVGLEPPPDTTLHYNALTAVGGTFVFAGEFLAQTWDALLSLPSKIDDLWTAVTGGPRSEDTPVSVYGASVMGGEAAENDAWVLFVMLLITINFFLGVFNLVPLLPLDGGHMAIVGYEKGRDTVRRWLHRAPGGPVDYMKLMPLTYAVVIVMGGFMILTLTADIVNPIKLFPN